MGFRLRASLVLTLCVYMTLAKPQKINKSLCPCEKAAAMAFYVLLSFRAGKSILVHGLMSHERTN